MTRAYNNQVLIEFRFGRRRYEAVGLLQEWRVAGGRNHMFGGYIKSDDWACLRLDLIKIPAKRKQELQATQWGDGSYGDDPEPWGVFCREDYCRWYEDGGWLSFWGWLLYLWLYGYLVVRRRKSY